MEKPFTKGASEVLGLVAPEGWVQQHLTNTLNLALLEWSKANPKATSGQVLTALFVLAAAHSEQSGVDEDDAVSAMHQAYEAIRNGIIGKVKSSKPLTEYTAEELRDGVKTNLERNQAEREALQSGAVMRSKTVH